MMHLSRDSRFAYRTLLTFAVFGIAFLFYMATACYVPYPGTSSQFILSLLFPWQYTMPQVDILSALATTAAVRFCSPESLMVCLAMFSAALGATIVTSIFRIVYFTVQFSCMELDSIRENEMARTTRDIGFCAEVTGLLTALVGMVSLPIWVLGTRPLPVTAAIAIASVLIALSIELRFRMGLLLQAYSEKLTLSDTLLALVTTGVSVAMATYSAPLFPVTLLLLILTFSPLFNAAALFRTHLLLTLLAGIVLGGVLSLCVVGGWLTYLTDESIPLLQAWLAHTGSTMQHVASVFTTPPDSFAVGLCALGLVFHIGCFPRAFIGLRRMLLGNLIMVALPIIALCGIPTAFWSTLEEPSALSVIGVLLFVTFSGGMLGAWGHLWLERNMHQKVRTAHNIALIILFIPMAIWGSANALSYWRAGVGAVAQAAMKEAIPSLDAIIPTTQKLWISDTTRLPSHFILHRYIHEAPFAGAPKHLSMAHRHREFCNPELARAFRDDPILKHLLPLGTKPVALYLAGAADDADFRSDTHFTTDTGNALISVIDKLATTVFAQTESGQKALRELHEWTADCFARGALREKDPVQKVSLLRTAMRLAPDNDAYPLGLEATAHAIGAPLTKDEQLCIVRIHEYYTWLNHPTWQHVERFDTTYGQVDTPPLATARRLNAIRTGDRANALAELNDLLHSAPTTLCEEELDILLLHADETHLGELLLSHAQEHPELLKTYLARYPLTATSRQLAKLHPDLIKDTPALAFCYAEKNLRHMEPDRMADRASAIFMANYDFRSALLFVNLCLLAENTERAQHFVSGFIAEKELASLAYGLEFLRLQVLSAIAKSDPSKAYALADHWLRKTPIQKSLWTFRLTDSSLSPAERLDIAKRCLSTDPTHPHAVNVMREHLRVIEGEAVARRYMDTIHKAYE